MAANFVTQYRLAPLGCLCLPSTVNDMPSTVPCVSFDLTAGQGLVTRLALIYAVAMAVR